MSNPLSEQEIREKLKPFLDELGKKIVNGIAISIATDEIYDTDYVEKFIEDEFVKRFTQYGNQREVDALNQVYEKRRLIIPNEHESIYVVDANIIKEMRISAQSQQGEQDESV